MNELSKKIVSMLKSNARDPVYVNTLAKLPIIVTKKRTSNDINGDIYSIDIDTNEEYLDGIELIIHSILKTNNVADKVAYLKQKFNDIHGDTFPIDNDTGREFLDGLYPISHDIITGDEFIDKTAFLRTSLTWWLWRKCRIINVKKFHYDDTWYSYRDSVETPEETFGILEVSNLPFKPFTKLVNKKSFICRMDQLMFNGTMQPFMLFINNKFVNWNIIDVVFDCDDMYLLLHGKQYSYHNLINVDVSIIILPFKTGYIGFESDEIWELNYKMLHGFLQDSLRMNDNNQIEIEVPTMYSIYKKRGMVYNIGSWLYTQLYMNHLGLLSDYRKSKLIRMILTRTIYDDSGNVISRYNTKFNAFDKDSYDRNIYNSICCSSLDYIKNRSIFKFNNDGLLDYENGENIIANLDESMVVDTNISSESNIIIDYSKYNECLFRESFIIFKSGLLYNECNMNRHGLNIFSINNNTEEDIAYISFKPAMIELMIRHHDNFINKEYFINKILENIKADNVDNKFNKLLQLSDEALNYVYFDNISYEENFNMGLKTIIGFNPLLLNDLTKSSIKSTTISGRKANESLEFNLGEETRYGLKIPRCRYKDHETYVIIFLNGELIENYSEMYAASNYFFLPVDNKFSNGDVIELLYFTDCNNNEIHFNITDNMISKLERSEDPEFVKFDLFKEYINSKDIKIFAKYPKEIMVYKDLIEETSNIAFNISYRDSNNNLLVFNKVIKNKSNDFTAVSSRKFIYERLYVDQKAYRIKLGERFRYCDNKKQYILFINGRRMEDDSFFITVPKYSRPFWGIYLYTRRFVNPEDRVEIFYVPEELYNINTEEMVPVEFGSDGYMKTNKNDLNVPFNSDFYLCFINGKKIANNHIIPIDSHTVRVKHNTRSLLRLNINPVYRITDNIITSYMKSDKLSKYDKLIQYIKDEYGYDELDRLFNTRIQMSDNEEDAIWRNVDRIAIINEIVRDFWISSGYRYNEQPFIYDYDLDEIIVKDKYGNYVLPAMDANPNINILKNNIRLLYLNINKESEVFEIGSSVDNLEFNWEFSNPINNGTVTTVSQYVNGIKLDNSARSYIHEESITEDTEFYFQFNTMQDTIDKTINIKFCNGIYYGTVDEDLLQHYNGSERNNLTLDKIIAIVAKDKEIPSSAEHELENESIEIIKKDNYIIYNLSFVKHGLPEGLIDLTDGSLIAVYEDGSMYRDIVIAEDGSSGLLIEGKEVYVINNMLKSAGINMAVYNDKNDLDRLMGTLNRVYQDSVTLDFDSYKIGSNNYFVYACPKRLAYENGRRIIRFNMPDINDPDVIEYGKDNHTTPIYTNGEFNKLDNTLIKLDECKMEFMDEFEYTNPSGYTETYVIWKSNGFFTRKYDDYEFKMSIMSETDFVGIENNIIVNDTEVIETAEELHKPEPIRVVNTASPTGVDINDNIIFIDTLIW